VETRKRWKEARRERRREGVMKEGRAVGREGTVFGLNLEESIIFSGDGCRRKSIGA